MYTDKYVFLTLIDKYLSGNATHLEALLVEEYYNKLSADTEISKELYVAAEDDLRETMLRNIRKQIVADRPKIRRFTFMRAAAAILIATIAISAYFYFSGAWGETGIQHAVQNDIAPGGNRAVLVLADGKRINLGDINNGQVIKATGVQIIKASDGQLTYEVTGEGGEEKPNALNTIYTPRGGQYQVILPDKTKVWLNASSSITYPTVFHGSERTVQISGEAYFEVARDKSRPFYVVSDEQKIEVLGTHFNVSAYTDEPSTSTTLLEGSIRIHTNSPDRPEEWILKPSQRATLSDGQLMVDVVDTEEAIAWKNGRFIFNNTDIQVVMRMVSRWYDVEVEYQGEVPQKTFIGDISKFENISELL